jgi:hypothetical protein
MARKPRSRRPKQGQSASGKPQDVRQHDCLANQWWLQREQRIQEYTERAMLKERLFPAN